MKPGPFPPNLENWAASGAAQYPQVSLPEGTFGWTNGTVHVSWLRGLPANGVVTIARRTGFSEMVSHRALTADRSVQETRFADGTVVTVDFKRRTVEVGAATANGTFSANLVGAQVTSWRPAALDGGEVFFLQAAPQWGEEVHGGAPICWPWFGGRGALPSHGIARYLPWRMEGGAPGGRALPEKGGASRFEKDSGWPKAKNRG